MFFIADSPQATVMMPVRIARSLDQMNYQVGKSEIAPPEFVEFINSMADESEHIRKTVVVKLSRKEAIIACRKIRSSIPELLAEEEAFRAKYTGTYSKSVVAMERWFESVRALIGETIYVARDRKISVEELDTFLLNEAKRDFATPASQKDRIVGKDAVMAIFED